MKFDKILVTGSCGFIASHFSNMLHEQGYSIFSVDKLTYAADRNNLNPEIPLIIKDINDLTIHDVHPLGIDCIVHFAAESHVDNALKDETPFHLTNYMGTANLLKITRDINVKRFIYVSTDEVYSTTPEGISFSETTPLNPSNVYAATKASAEMLVNAYHHTYGLNTIITRGSNTFGENQFHEKLIPLCIERALKNQPLPIYGDGSATRMYIYVKDHAKAIEHCMNFGISGEVYNIPGTIELSALQVAEYICSITGASKDLITFVEDRKGHDMCYRINGSKLMLLDFIYKYAHFYPMLEQTVEYYKEKLK